MFLTLFFFFYNFQFSILFVHDTIRILHRVRRTPDAHTVCPSAEDNRPCAAQKCTIQQPSGAANRIFGGGRRSPVLPPTAALPRTAAGPRRLPAAPAAGTPAISCGFCPYPAGFLQRSSAKSQFFEKQKLTIAFGFVLLYN